MKTIIYEDKTGYANLQKDVASVCEAANDLIENYNQYGLTRVTSLQDCINLINDPVEHFDRPLIDKVTKIEGLEVNPEQLAKMYNIDRQAYLESVFGAKLIKSGVCVSCLPDVEILGGYDLHRKFEEYQNYLQFKSGTFTVDQGAIDQAKESYIVYADPDQETALQELETFISLCNRFADAGILPASLLEQMKLFSYSQDTHRLNMPYDKLQLLTKILNHENTKTRAGTIEN